MNQELFAEDTSIETCFNALVVYPDDVNCVRRMHGTLYDAKIWIIEKLFLYKKSGNSDKFPFGFDYCVVTSTGIINAEQLNLP